MQDLSPITIRQFDHPREFLDRAEAWLCLNEPAHNLTLGIAYALVEGDARYEKPTLLATIERAGEVVGTAFRTPPHKLCITDLPLDAIAPLVQVVTDLYPTIPAILGPQEAATAVAKQWSEVRGHQFRAGRGQGIYAATEVHFPVNPPAGTLRLAEEADYDLLVEWMNGFVAYTGHSYTQVEPLIRIRLDQGGMYLWDDGEPRCMVAVAGQTPTGIRVGPVYTPDAYRGRGYASIATARLTAKMLTSGRKSCFLYTDLANPTSNSIYMKIGYEHVTNVVDIDLIS